MGTVRNPPGEKCTFIHRIIPEQQPIGRHHVLWGYKALTPLSPRKNQRGAALPFRLPDQDGHSVISGHFATFRLGAARRMDSGCLDVAIGGLRAAL